MTNGIDHSVDVGGMIDVNKPIEIEAVLEAFESGVAGGGKWVVVGGSFFVKGGLNVTNDIVVKGDVKLVNADCAEDFDISSAALQPIEPGTVMVLNEHGSLEPSSQAYDKKVAGVISGAGGYKPGLVLDKKQEPQLSGNNITRMPLALVGKVYCKVDAFLSPIEIGDLLTSSSTAGHAMKVTDASKAFGSVIGKALKPFREGKGIIPILIALQ